MDRSKKIPVSETNNWTQEGTHHYELHIPVPKPIQESAHSSEPKPSSAPQKIVQQSSKPSVKVRVWNFLEWIATSAIIFVILFFAANYSSYSELFKNKINQLGQTISSNSDIAKIINQNKPQTEELLPTANSVDQSKKQIPDFNMAIITPDDRILIPRINQNVPIVKVSTENLLLRDWNALEKQIQEALRDGVVHYPGTAEPGDRGNVVITGHSSYFPWDPGRFKDVFALLHQVKIGDEVIVYHNQKAYLYQVYDKKVITPDKVDVLTQEGDNRLTLITCTPVGTNLKRLVVLAKPIDS